MPPEPGVRVLLVEDSRTQAEALRLVLQSGGFLVDTAASAEAARARLAHGGIDFIVSDIVMPGASGYDLCREVKRDPGIASIPVLLLTSLREPIDVIHALECGADSFLNKPCEPEQLLSRVASLLENRRLRREAADGSGVAVLFAGQRFTVPSGREQILDLLVSTFEDMVRKQAEIESARDALAAKHEQLLRVERQKEELAALVVHDLRSPAAGILMAAQSRLRSPALSDADRTLWSLVFTSAEVINRMVLNLLDIAGSDDGTVTPRPRSVETARFLDDVRRLMTPAADSLEHAIDVEVAEDVPVLHVDPDLLRRVLQNLIDNALRHSPPGTPVRVEVQASGLDVHVRVRDQGSGVPPEMRARVFDKYVRLPGAHGESSTFGKGLGLAFCRLAIEAHGGRVWVEDNVPCGSTFVVSLPAGGHRARA